MTHNTNLRSFREVSVGTCQSPLGDGWVFKAIVTCLIQIFMANVFLF